MKFANIDRTAFFVLSAVACLPSTVCATPLLGTDLISFSVLAGSYATYGADAIINGRVGAMSYVVGGANSASEGNFTNTVAVANALAQLETAQRAVNNMGTGTVLAPTMSGSQTLSPGVYSASALTTAAGTILQLDGGGADRPFWVFNIPTYLVTGASTTIKIINSGDNASVIWNTGGYTSLGADTDFIGTILSEAYISAGANSNISCGYAFSASYVALPANAYLQSANCFGSDTWLGSSYGLGSSLEIVNDVAVASTFQSSASKLAADAQSAEPALISEPKIYTLLLTGFGLLGLMGICRKS